LAAGAVLIFCVAGSSLAPAGRLGARGARGANVILACRDKDRAAAAAGRIRETVPHASLRTALLDLSSMASVRQAAEELHRCREPT
jgi:NAD(P)-dependent dehydrogenase (short-subunit alcohol dehydrogenase family)